MVLPTGAWRGLTLALTLLTLGSALGLAVDGTLHPPRDFGSAAYSEAREGDDYFVFTRMGPPEDLVLAGTWTAPGAPPDRVLLVDFLDLDRIAKGQEPLTVFRAWEAPGESGTVRERIPPDCRDGCPVENIPFLAWVRGDAWVGVDLVDMRRGEWSDGDGAISFDARLLDGGTEDRRTLWEVAAVVGGALALAGAAGWFISLRGPSGTPRDRK